MRDLTTPMRAIVPVALVIAVLALVGCRTSKVSTDMSQTSDSVLVTESSQTASRLETLLSSMSFAFDTLEVWIEQYGSEGNTPTAVAYASSSSAPVFVDSSGSLPMQYYVLSQGDSADGTHVVLLPTQTYANKDITQASGYKATRPYVPPDATHSSAVAIPHTQIHLKATGAKASAKTESSTQEVNTAQHADSVKSTKSAKTDTVVSKKRPIAAFGWLIALAFIALLVILYRRFR